MVHAGCLAPAGLDEPALDAALECLLAAGFLWTVEDSGPERRFTYRPSSPALAELTDAICTSCPGKAKRSRRLSARVHLVVHHQDAEPGPRLAHRGLRLLSAG